MKIDYTSIISPFPLRVSGVGNIKSPKLKDIWSPKVTIEKYEMFLALISMNVKIYCCTVDQQKKEWYDSLSNDEKNSINMFDLIILDPELRGQYMAILNFFFVEDIYWDEQSRVLCTYITDADNTSKIVGVIHRDNWNEVSDIILQMNGVKKSGNSNQMRFKSDFTREIWELTHPEELGAQKNKNMELGNIISAVAAMANSLNITNIWELTVGQLFDQFDRIQNNIFFKSLCLNVAVWGDEKNKFNGIAWYENRYENEKQ